jgi:serralysin
MVAEMAKLIANIGIDPDDLDFEQFNDGVFQNDDATQDTEFEVLGQVSGLPIVVTVTGEGFQYLDVAQGEVPFTGTIDSISVSSFGFDAFSLSNITRDANDAGGAFALTVEKVLEVASTDRTTDDLALVRKILAGNDQLVGSGDGDQLFGFGGSDTIFGNGGGDLINGGAGKDTASYAKSTAGVTIDLGNPAANLGDAAGDALIDIEYIAGSNKGDDFTGSAGDDRFNGGKGKDTVDGGDGDDIFEFTVKLSGKNADRVQNFVSGEDTLFLSKKFFQDVNEDSVGVSQSNFVIGAAALDDNDRIIYNDANGKLFYDADGSGDGAKKLFATLDPGTELGRGDFELF